MAASAARQRRAPGDVADKPGVPLGDALSRLPPHKLYESLPRDKRRITMDTIGWINTIIRAQTPRSKIIEELCQRFIDLGIPLDRYGSSTTVLTADHDAIGRVWVRGKGIRETIYVRPGAEDPEYRASPLYEAASTQSWVELWLPDTPDERFGIVRQLKDEGYVHYICIPLSLSNKSDGWLFFATKAQQGFSAENLTIIALVMPSVISIIDAFVAWLTLDSLLRTYVGDEPHRAILDGNVKRGQVSTIRSAILFADIRDSTGHTAELSAVQAVSLFNEVFDCLVPPIEARGGEVLKYLGDGLLAIFREAKGRVHDAASRALASAEEVLVNLHRYNGTRGDQRSVDLGIALHYGEAAYGNVGSGLRLDFTVIGRDVGLASRIGGMNARLGEPLLMSEAFIARLDRPVVSLGAYPARGFTKPVAVFRPDVPEPSTP